MAAEDQLYKEKKQILLLYYIITVYVTRKYVEQYTYRRINWNKVLERMVRNLK